ncbi:uncharacterized protein LOC112596724 [Melanaphis sacchari]|uniref:uncharacterized protein LOC112596724 n=1 Tax=Melanaphis sacchari TaxID=742174 RepID=UPI000DC136B5|nr:uncharacterized protein LOC112596724 [Melanaphis sacchari]
MDYQSRATTAVTVILLALGLLASCGAIVFPTDRQPGTSTVNVTRRNHRTPRDMQELKTNAHGLDLLSAGLKTTGQKWSSDEYQTLSTLQQQTSDDDSLQPVTTKVDIYPALTTNSLPFVTRTQYVSNHLHQPYYHNMHEDDRNTHQQETMDLEDQRTGYSPAKWNRYYPSHRQFKKYGPVVMETDVAADGSTSMTGGYNVYDNGGMDYGTSTSYELENIKNANIGSSGGGNGIVSWFSDPPTQSSRPAPIVAEIRQPSNKMSIDAHKLTLMAIAKIALAKLKVLTAIKFLIFLWVKLKLLVILKGFIFAKLTVIGKFLKIFLLPFLPYLISWLRNIIMMNMNPSMNMPMPNLNNMLSNAIQSRNDSVPDPALRRSTADLDTLNVAGNLLRFVAFVQSSKCVERTACRISSTRPLSLQTTLANWIFSPLLIYIPNKKLKSYLSTLKEVSDYRLENITSYPSTIEWLKWCDERYYCDEEEEDTDDNLI